MSCSSGYALFLNIEKRKAYSIYLVLFKAAAPFSWIHEISTLKSCGWVLYLQSSILFSTLEENPKYCAVLIFVLKLGKLFYRALSTPPDLINEADVPKHSHNFPML